MKSFYAAAIMCFATCAESATLEFDGLRDAYLANYEVPYDPNTVPVSNNIIYEEDGYRVSAHAEYPELAFAYTEGSLNLYTNTYGNSNPFHVATITKIGGAAFSLLEFDVTLINGISLLYVQQWDNKYRSESFAFPWGEMLEVNAVKANGGKVSATLSAPDQNILKRTVTNADLGGKFTDIVSLEFKMDQDFDRWKKVEAAHCSKLYLSKLSRHNDIDFATCGRTDRHTGGSLYSWYLFDSISEGGAGFTEIQSITLADSDAVVTQVPLPAGGWLLLVGLGCLAFRRRPRQL